ncbi:MAG: radical SAM family heme chaperone HemW [Hyphomicrobiales bacterium]
MIERDRTTGAGTDAVGTPDIGFGIYVHWPFCKAKCPYCDFNSHVRHGGLDQDRFAAGLVRELETMAARTPGRRVTSVFFGGGTPSLMTADTVETVLSAIAALWPVEPDAEITLEANPTSVEAARFRDYRAAGVNRVSIGVQSLDDRALKFLGRQHTSDEAMEAVTLAREVFARVSFDLIYGRPGQTGAGWRDELGAALAHAPDHLSLYQLTIEPDTTFAALHEAGSLAMPDDDHLAALYDGTAELCAGRGLTAYEVSNYALDGAESRHNLVYWRYGEYAGVGPGAHSRLAEGRGRTAIETVKHPETWLAAVAERGAGHAGERRLSPEECADEMLLMGLRLSEGVDLDRYAVMGGRRPGQQKLADLAGLGLIEVRAGGQHIHATAKGRLVLNAVIAELSSD